jgi:large subunit ribosomal protein L13
LTLARSRSYTAVTAGSGRFFMTQIQMPTTRTFSPAPRHIERRWYVVDADGVVLGRLASEVAKILRGKHKPIFAPHADTGDHVVVVNARGIRLTGGKEQSKIYYRHSQYPGGLREVGYERLLAERPVVAVEKAIRGMLPKNRLGRQMFRKLSVYEGPEHPHQAQRPEPLALGAIPKWDGLPVPKEPPAPSDKPTPKRPAPASAPASGRRRPAAEAPKRPARAKAKPKAEES